MGRATAKTAGGEQGGCVRGGGEVEGEGDAGNPSPQHGPWQHNSRLPYLPK